MEEIEVKFLDIDLEAISKKLKEAGANKSGDFFYRYVTFDYPDWRLDKKGAWLRLREEDGKTMLAFKERIGRTADDGSASDTGMKEIEVEVGDYEKTRIIFKEIGFIEKHYAEKKRVRWMKGDVEFDIDTYPEIPPYLEIEAPSWEHIDKAIEELGLDPKDKKIFSANQIYALHGITVADYDRLAFDGLIKRE